MSTLPAFDTDNPYWDRRWFPAAADPALGTNAGRGAPMADVGVDLVQVADTPCLILLGEPGMGKTTEIGRLNSALRDRSVQVDLVSARDPHLAKALEDLLASAHHGRWVRDGAPWHILIDGLDELRPATASPADQLGGFLDQLFASKANITSLHIVLTSRPAAWTPSFQDMVARRWPIASFQVLMLAPLDDDQIRRAVAQGRAGPDAKALADRLLDPGLKSLAARPFLLRLLLAAFHEADTPDLQQSDLLSRAIDGALVATDAEGAPLQRDHFAVVAARMAAASSFSQLYRLTTLPVSTARDAVAIVQLAGGSEPTADGSFVVTPLLLERVLSSSLFTSVGPSTYEWGHRQLAEFLTARYLASHRLSPEQILSLLMVQEAGGPGGIAPPFHELAAWTASLVPSFFEVLVDREPDVLLQADTALASPARARLTTALLARVATGSLLDRYQQLLPLLHRLAHPGLGQQLLPIVADRDSPPILRRFAIEVAVATSRTELVPELVALARDTRSDGQIRAAAVRAVDRLGDDGARALLVTILQEDLLNDPDDRLRGDVIATCWPVALPFNALLAALTPPKQANFIGTYAFFLHRFEPPELSEQMALDALSWLALRVDLRNEDHDRLRRPAGRLFAAVVAQVNLPAVRLALSDFIVSADIDLATLPLQDRRSGSIWPEDQTVRVALVETILGRSKDPARAVGIVLYHLSGLVLPEDLLAYVEAAGKAVDDRVAAALAQVALSLAKDGLPDALAPLWELADRQPALTTLLQARLWVPLDGEHTSYLQERARRERDAAARAAQDAEDTGSGLDPILALLAQIDTGDAGLWWQLNLQLFVSETAGYESEFEFRSDLTAAPGWRTLDPEDQDRVVATAARYLVEAPLSDISWLGTNTSHRPASAGVRALRLLAEKAPAAYRDLSPETWAVWAPATIGFFENDFYSDGQGQRSLVADAYRHAPEAVLSALERIATNPTSEGLTSRVFGLLEDALDPQLVSLLLDLRARQTLRGEKASNDILSFLARMGEPAAGDAVVSAMREASENRLPADAEDVAAAAAQLLLKDPPDYWYLLLDLTTRNPDFARQIWRAYANAWSFDHHRSHAGISEYGLAQAYLDVGLLLPERPSTETGARVLGIPDYIEQLRSALLAQLVEAGTNAALEQLTRLELMVPDGKELLRWPIAEARRAVRAAQARLRDPADILAVIGAMTAPADPPVDLPAERPDETARIPLDLNLILPAPEPEGPLPPGESRRILAVATEWSSAHGGVSTLNRELCAALATLGHSVTCLVLDALEDEVLQAASRGVTLRQCQTAIGITGSERFLLCDPRYLTEIPDIVLGHDHVTGRHARAIAERLGAKYVHLLHTIPQENEGLKVETTDRRRGLLDGETKMSQQIALGKSADLVVAIGPRIQRHFRSAALSARVAMLVPGLDKDLLALEPDLAFVTVNSCLMSARMEDAAAKGLLLGCATMGAVVQNRDWPSGKRPNLVVRGFDPAAADAQVSVVGEFKRYTAFVQTRSYSANRADMLDEYRRSAVVIMPSKAEGFGLAALEAIAAGVPTLMTDQSGLAELLRDLVVNDGLDKDLVEPCIAAVSADEDVDRDVWANKLDVIMFDHEAAFSRARRLRSALVPRLSWDKCARALSRDLLTL